MLTKATFVTLGVIVFAARFLTVAWPRPEARRWSLVWLWLAPLAIIWVWIAQHWEESAAAWQEAYWTDIAQCQLQSAVQSESALETQPRSMFADYIDQARAVSRPCVDSLLELACEYPDDCRQQLQPIARNNRNKLEVAVYETSTRSTDLELSFLRPFDQTRFSQALAGITADLSSNYHSEPTPIPPDFI